MHDLAIEWLALSVHRPWDIIARRLHRKVAPEPPEDDQTSAPSRPVTHEGWPAVRVRGLASLGLIAIFAAQVGERTTPSSRVGIGHDTHRLVEGGPLRLGGVDVPHTRQADAHSDGDVVLHALIDALLGATAQGDIGEWFPDQDAENRDRDSAEMVSIVMKSVGQADLEVANVDCTIFAQQPKLSPYKDAIRRRIAELLAIDFERVGLKAKTGEGVGPVGREEAIAAQCVVLLRDV